MYLFIFFFFTVNLFGFVSKQIYYFLIKNKKYIKDKIPVFLEHRLQILCLLNNYQHHI